MDLGTLSPHAPWPPGTHITGRGIWFGRVFAAWPFVVVEETETHIAAYIPPGSVWKRPTNLAGNDIRLPHGDWRLRDDVWHGHGMVRSFSRLQACMMAVATPNLVGKGRTASCNDGVRSSPPSQRAPP